MRRKEREIKDESEIERIISKALVCRVAVCESDRPYIIPMCFGFKDGILFFHSAQEGKKVEILKKNNRVCFEMDVGTELVEGEKGCDWGIKYASVVGYGQAKFVEDLQEKRKALSILLGHYSNKKYEFSGDSLDQVAIIKIQIESLTGKKAVLGG